MSKHNKGHVVKEISLSVNELQQSITISGVTPKGVRYLSMTFEEALKIRNQLYAMEELDECQPG